ncbi:conserved hypothetical protein [Ricinus communis]|uniref:RNase H type-1 domain-containing protein n=1 Tax=Ricinus communis TaxID=3988 RepID=B9STF1_RICCO|nr:conserved hypothetical protein [Ricinus communis]
MESQLLWEIHGYLEPLHSNGIRVRDLMKEAGTCWDEIKVDQMFIASDAEIIKANPISRHGLEDKNKILFKQKNFSLKQILIMINKMHSELIQAQKPTKIRRQAYECIWRPPLIGYTKINTDAGKVGHRCWGLGAVLCVEKGRVLSAWNKMVKNIDEVIIQKLRPCCEGAHCRK